MNILEIAQRDKSFTLNDKEYGFGSTIKLTDPDLHSADVIGRSNDISFALDTNTGVAVSGRTATVAIDMNELIEKGFSSLHSAQSDKTKKPWIIEFDDQQGNTHVFTVLEGNPDRTLGIVLCTLQFYKK
jgi:hypothetical protein